MAWREFGILFPVVPQKQEHNECIIHHSNPHISFLQLEITFVFMFTISCVSHVQAHGKCWDLAGHNRHSEPLAWVTFLPAIN